jgi:hypothetical protein
MSQNNYYVLRHTVEEIDNKLNLINENKNLLPYPYETALPTGLEDVGDGSILTTEIFIDAPEEGFLLNTCTLSAGKYTVSLVVTDIIRDGDAVANEGFSLKVSAAGSVLANTATFATFELADETAVEVYLVAPLYLSKAGSVIKPQIELGEEKTSWVWVPYMKDIGNYVDERFNGTNTKIKAVTNMCDSQINNLWENFINTYIPQIATDIVESKIGEVLNTEV